MWINIVTLYTTGFSFGLLNLYLLFFIHFAIVLLFVSSPLFLNCIQLVLYLDLSMENVVSCLRGGGLSVYYSLNIVNLRVGDVRQCLFVCLFVSLLG